MAETTGDSPRDLAFIRVFLVVVVLVVTLGGVASYLINPYGHFRTNNFAPRVPTDRDEKLSLYRAMLPAPRVVIIGSSHLKKLDPSCITRATGLSAFNFAVDGGGLDDFEAVMRIVAASPPEQIVLGISPGLFTYVPGVPAHSMWSREFSKYIDATLEERINAVGRMLWSQAALLDDLAVVRRGRARKRSHSHRPDGLLETTGEDQQQREGRFDLEARLVPSIARLVPIYAGMNVDSRRVERLRTLLSDARRRGIDVVAFMPPLHPQLVRAIAQNRNGLAPLKDVVAIIEQLVTDGLVRSRPTTLEDFGGDPRDFLDADHMNGQNASRLLEHLVGRKGSCAVQ